MSRHGHKRDGELDAMCRYTQWLCKVVKLVDDPDAAAFCKKISLLTLNELIKEQAAMNGGAIDLVKERLSDCSDCKAHGNKPCFENGRYVGCKWYSAQSRKEFTRAHFGDDAIKYLEKYRDIGRRKQT